MATELNPNSAQGRDGWLESLKVYADRQVLAILFLGFSSGLPILLVLTTLSAWLREEGVSRSTIGLFGFVMAPYALKFIWAPLVDRLPIPLLTAWLGRRRSWMLLTQIALVGVIYGFGQTDPGVDLYWTAVFAVLITFFSATQDIAIDAYRIDSLPEEKLGAGAGVVVLGYRVGMWVATAGALLIASESGWDIAYAAMAGLMVVGILTTLVIREPDGSTAALIDDETERQDRAILEIRPREIARLQGVGGLLLITVAVLLALQPLSYAFAFVTNWHNEIAPDVANATWLLAGGRLALAVWGMWIGLLMLRADRRAPGEAKDFVFVSLLWLLAEIAAYVHGVWFAELYAAVLLYSMWFAGNLATSLFGHGLSLESFHQPIWLMVMGWWLRFFFLVFLYGFFYFSKRAIANFGAITARQENPVHLWTRRAIVEPYYDFFSRHGVGIALAILVLISVFKASDAVLTSMANPFYIDVGFTTAQIAIVSKTFGLFMTLLGGLVGGIIVYRLGILRSMVLAVLVMALSNLMFAMLAVTGAEALAITDLGFAEDRDLTEAEAAAKAAIGVSLMPQFYALIIIENISGGLGTAVFVAYLSALCNRSFSAVQYAMLTSFMQMFAKFIVVPSSGFYADATGWFWFFVTSTMFAVPALIVLWFLMSRLPAQSGEPAATAAEPAE